MLAARLEAFKAAAIRKGDVFMDWTNPELITLDGENRAQEKCVNGNAPKKYCVGGGTLFYVECWGGEAIAFPVCTPGSSIW